MIKYYQLLGLTENASIDEIKRSYRKLAFHYHPDRNDSPGAQEKFLLIQEAYEVLTGKKKIAQPKVGDYSKRRTRPDESWEDKVKKARAKYEENKQYQEKAIANYFKKLRSGWRWQLNKVVCIVGIPNNSSSNIELCTLNLSITPTSRIPKAVSTDVPNVV